MQRARILVIDDEPAMLENCERLLSAEGYQCSTLAEPAMYRETLATAQPDVLLVDLRMPGVDGMTVLGAALADDPARPVIIITAHATVSSAVEAMREGAFDYLTKPFSAEQLLVAIERAVRFRLLVIENRSLRAQVVRDLSADGIVGSSHALVKLMDQVRRVAPTEANVLITGESGSGKELIARSVHTASPRSGRPFIPVDCAALPEGLLESELFGHERGAFTGAVGRRKGLLLEANGGTVFLDELAEMSPALQSKLLRVLEQRQIRRLGDARLVDVDIRVVAATNTDLDAAVLAGSFRADLYYRLNVVHLKVPPLRERREDIVLLARAFFEKYAVETHKEIPQVDPDVWAALEQFNWPGNVRELKNLVQRLVVLDADGRVSLPDLPDGIRDHQPAAGPGSLDPVADYSDAQSRALREFRASYLKQLLDRHDGNVTRAARTAGVSRRTLHRWLAENAATPAGAAR